MTVVIDYGQISLHGAGEEQLTIVIDYGQISIMQEVAISEFKAKCLAMLEQVRKTKKPIRITRRGKPVAEVVPASPAKPAGDWLGFMRGTGKIVCDIVSPVIDLDDIEAMRD